MLESVLANPAGFSTIVTADQNRGLVLSNLAGIFATFADDLNIPFHAVNDPRPAFNWISSQTTRKIVVVQLCGADLEDNTAAIDPALGYRPLIKASSNPILIELNEEVAPALQ